MFWELCAMRKSQFHQKENRFFNLYKIIKERENAFSDAAKIVQYGMLLRYLMAYINQTEEVSAKIYLLIYQLDIKLGDIYYDEALQNQDNGRYFLAAQYYNQALIYAQNQIEQNRVLSALRDVYYYLNDEEALFQIEKAWAENQDEKDKCAAFRLLAQNTMQLKFKVAFLQSALDVVMVQDGNFYEKYQDTLNICSQLAVLYELSGEKEKACKIKKMREDTLKLLN